jgi:hypothetical protein
VNIGKYVYGSFFTYAADAEVQHIQVSAYPNPCTDHLHFGFDSPPKKPVHIALYDLQGCLRMQTTMHSEVKEFAVPISESLENGAYVYRITTAQGHASGKVVVQH